MYLVGDRLYVRAGECISKIDFPNCDYAEIKLGLRIFEMVNHGISAQLVLFSLQVKIRPDQFIQNSQ